MLTHRRTLLLPKQPRYRSGLEVRVADQLNGAGVRFEYEEHVIHYVKAGVNCRYTPDFLLPNGVLLETKGRLSSADREKHLAIKRQFPDLDIRFIFSNPRSKIKANSRVTYAIWSDYHGFSYAKGLIPALWLDEPLEENRPKDLADR